MFFCISIDAREPSGDSGFAALGEFNHGGVSVDADDGGLGNYRLLPSHIKDRIDAAFVCERFCVCDEFGEVGFPQACCAHDFFAELEHLVRRLKPALPCWLEHPCWLERGGCR